MSDVENLDWKDMDVMAWKEMFKPIICLETSAEEYSCVAFMLVFFPEHVWTDYQGDIDSSACISNGWRFVNRLGYWITEEPAKPATFYQVSYD